MAMTLRDTRDTLASWLGGSEACLDAPKVALLSQMVAACDAHTTQPAQAVDVTRETATLVWSWYIESRDKEMLEGGSKDPLVHMQAALTRAFRALAGEQVRWRVPERRFPMQRGPSIPWSLAEVIYAGYAAMYGKSQTLERLAERGGFSWREVDVLYNDRDQRGRKAMDAAIASLPASPTPKGD